MPGLPLAAIASGLGQAFNNYEQQRQEQQKRQILAQQLRQKQQEEQAGSMLFSALAGGGVGGGLNDNGVGGGLNLPGSTQMPGGMSPDQMIQSPTPSADRFAQPPAGSGMSSGLRPNPQRNAWLNQNLPGPTMAHPGGAQPISFTIATPDPSVPDQRGFDSSGPASPLSGTTPLTPDLIPPPRAGGGPNAPGLLAQNAPPAIAGGPPPRTPISDPNVTALPAPVRQAVDQTVQQTASSIPQGLQGRMSMQALAQQIEKANPEAPPVVKMMALERAAKLLAPDQNQMMQMFMLQARQGMQVDLEKMREGFRHDQQLLQQQFQADQHTQQQDAAASRGEAGKWNFITKPDGSIVRANTATGEVAPVDNLAPGSEKMGTHGSGRSASPGSGEMASKNIEVVDDKGDVVWSGAARESKNRRGWEMPDGKPVPGGTVKIMPGTSMVVGSRENVLVQRSLTAAKEIATELQNVSQMPIQVSSGLFGGRKQGPGLLAAGREVLANNVTGEDVQVYNASVAGLQRELAGLVTGGVYINQHTIDAFNQLTLKEGDTQLTKMYKMALVRQNAENALESLLTNPRLAKKQQDYAQKLIEDMDKAIPWKPADVIKLRESADPQVTIGQIAKSSGLVGEVPAQAIAELKQDPDPRRQKQFDEVFGPGAAKKALGQ